MTILGSADCDPYAAIQTFYTDAYGSYTFYGVFPGSYRMAINGWEGTDYPVEPYGSSCSGPIEKTAGSGYVLDWSLHRTDLQITYPSEGATLTNSRPTLSWQSYPYATHYVIYLFQSAPTDERIEWGTQVTGTSFTPADPLTPGGTFWLYVWAMENNQEIAVAKTWFQIQYIG